MTNPFLTIIILLVVGIISVFAIKFLFYRSKTLKYGNLSYLINFIAALVGSFIGILFGVYVFKNASFLTLYDYNIPICLILSLLFSYICYHYMISPNKEKNNSKTEDESNKKMWNVINNDHNN